jgi:hypothetical protein
MFSVSQGVFKSYATSLLGRMKLISFLLGLLVFVILLIHTKVLRVTLGNPEVTLTGNANVTVTNASDLVKFQSGSTDAFGRLRTSDPYTLFDSSFRFADNGLWTTSTSGTTDVSYATGSMLLTIDGTLGSKILRETTKVFAYQPGKSLLILSTMAFAPPKTNLRQRIGYFGSANGLYLEHDGTTLYIVLRSESLGTTVRVAQSNWNGSTFLTTPRVLDISKTNIFWMDVEWLGVGDVRLGFIVDGAFVLAHTFHNDNINLKPYMTTASLPLRMELENTGNTGSSSTFTQICNTVISEGGYALHGTQISVGTAIQSSRTSSGTAGTFLPIVALKLKTAKLDAIVIPTSVSLLGLGNNVTWKYELRANSTVTGGSFTEVSADSAVEYNTGGTAVSGGRVLASGYMRSDTQGATVFTILKEGLFRNQLERNSFTSTPYTLSLCMAASTTSQPCFASIDWEEVTR